MRLEPINNKVVVRRDPKVGVRGKIILPETGHSQSYLGTVVSVGPGQIEPCPACGVDKWRPTCVQVGDRVILPELGGQPINDWDGPEALDGQGGHCQVVIIEDDFLKGRVIE